MKSKFLTMFLMAGMLVVTGAVLTGSASAQVLRNQTRYSRADVGRIIAKLETSSDQFRRDFDTAMDRSQLNGTQEEDRFNDIVNNYASSLDRLRRDFNQQNSWWQVQNSVSDVINNGQAVNSIMVNLQFRRQIERRWNTMRNDLNKLADTFDMPGIDGGGWNGGGWNGGNNGDNGNWGNNGNPPSWAVGTFYGRSPQTGDAITMVVNRNGAVTLTYGVGQGNATYAQMNGNTLRNGPYTSRVTRINNGIRTTDQGSGQSIDYFSNRTDGGGWNNGGNNGNNGNWGGGGGNVPSWAVGTFYTSNPQTGGTITMTIDNNGYVVLLYDGGNPTSATLNGTILTNGPYQSRVSRIRNGIRTTSTTNNQSIDYYRR